MHEDNLSRPWRAFLPARRSATSPAWAFAAGAAHPLFVIYGGLWTMAGVCKRAKAA